MWLFLSGRCIVYDMYNIVHFALSSSVTFAYNNIRCTESKYVLFLCKRKRIVSIDKTTLITVYSLYGFYI